MTGTFMLWLMPDLIVRDDGGILLALLEFEFLPSPNSILLYSIYRMVSLSSFLDSHSKISMKLLAKLRIGVTLRLKDPSASMD